MSLRADLRVLRCLAAFALVCVPGCDDPADESALIAADEALAVGVPLVLDDAQLHRCGADHAAEVALADAPAAADEAVGEAAPLALSDAREDDALAAAPLFQMPFFVHQKWRASTYDGHLPDQNSVDLINVNGASLGQVVVASAAGTVKEIGPVLSPQGDYYGDYVHIDHGDGWETRYLHIVRSGAIVKGTPVVRGQRLGTIGTYFDMDEHLHYTQLKDGATVRISFNGTPIDVYKGSKKPDGTYPTQELVSNNMPTGITVNAIAAGATARATAGAGLRAVVYCTNVKAIESTQYGPWVAAGQTSSVTCPSGFWSDGESFDLY